MGLLWFSAYMVIGAILCAIYIYLADEVRGIDHEFDIFVGVLTGLFFPVLSSG